jgi:hypothetical protein
VAAACPGGVARLGALDCLVGNRGQEARRAKTTGSREGAIDAKFPMRKGQLWATALSARLRPPARVLGRDDRRALRYLGKRMVMDGEPDNYWIAADGNKGERALAGEPRGGAFGRL